MSPRELEEKLGHTIRNERIATNEVLVLINEALRTKAYLELGYPSLFEWLTVKFGYSNAAAQRRIDAARMLRAVPQVAEKLNSGVVNLSTVTKVQQIIRIHEKSGARVSKSEKAELLEKIEHKTERETEQLMISLYPEAASQVNRDQVRVIDAQTSRLSVNLSNEVLADLKRAKELLSHALPEGSEGDVLAYVLKFFLGRKDPLKKQEKRVTSGAEVRGHETYVTSASEVKKSETATSGPEVRRSEKATSGSEAGKLAEVTSGAEVKGHEKRVISGPEVRGHEKHVTSASEVKKSETATSGSELEKQERRMAPSAEVRKRIPIRAAVRRTVLKRTNGACAFIDPITNKTCGSRHQIEIDHILPLALGGNNRPENLRTLCRRHNLLMAERAFS